MINQHTSSAVYVQTNDAAVNEVLAFAGDGRHLIVVNAGSDDVSLFTIGPDGPRLADRVASDGVAPTSVSIAGSLVYVLNNGSASISGFKIDSDRLVPLEGSRRVLSSVDADPAQIAFSPDGRVLAVTERGTDSISTFTLDQSGIA